jgi:hypothetical protein
VPHPNFPPRLRLKAPATVVLCALAAFAIAVPARAEQQTFGGIPVIVLQGTHYQRGYTHGKLLHSKIIDVADNYLMRGVNPTLFLMMLRTAGPIIKVDKGIEEEAKGLVAGAREAGGGTFRSEHSSSDFTWMEVLALSSYVDYVGANCSSVSAWGEATQESSLKGESAIARNLDWSNHEALLRNQVLFVHLPAEQDEVPFVSIGFAGLMGCLSCMNQQGLGAFLNLGYANRAGTFPPKEDFTPAALAFRKAIEMKAGTTVSPLDHFVQLLTDSARVGSFIIQAIAPQSRVAQAAVVVELLPDEYALRRAADDDRLESGVLVATNHNRKANKPTDCSRYQTAVDYTATIKKKYSRDRLWTVLEKMRRADTMQALLFVPSTGEFRLSTRQAGSKKLKKTRTSTMTPVETTTLKAFFDVKAVTP